MKNYTIGGVEVVSQILANKFFDEGHQISFVAFETPPKLLTQQLNNGIIVHILENSISSKKNIRKLNEIIINNNVDIIINQWGLPYNLAYLCKKSIEKTKVKLISVYHNNPSANARIIDVQIAIARTSNSIVKAILKIKKFLFKQITVVSMRYSYNKSDLYVILSESFILPFREFTKLKNIDKLLVITNPQTIDSKGFVYESQSKKKEVIYVGRIDYNQKRVSRIVEAWSLIENKFPDWNLTIVGDGPEKLNILTQINNLNLKNVVIEGFQNPKKYYERASVLLLTSEYEGFPLVLPESMSFGVVPIVYGSYPAVFDVIQSEINGIIVGPDEKGFNVNLMAQNLEKVMSNKSLLQNMAQNAIQTSKRFSIEKIYNLWMNVFDNLNAKNNYYL